MPKKLDDCVKAVIASGKTEEQAHAICQAQFKDTYTGEFRDAAVFNASEKSAVSVRDGVIDYLGIELNMEPPDRTFTVYRSPATIANTAMKMRGLPITDEHVPLDVSPPTEGGFVSEAEMVDAHDGNTVSTIAIRNQLAISDTLLLTVEAGKRELSLGYHADLVPHDEYDFEQRNIKPHHLAAVERGRCGSMCSFIDKKPEDKPMAKKSTLHKAFNDADGMMSLQQIVELATALPEAIKSVPVDQLQELLPALQTIVEAAKSVMPEEEKTTPDGDDPLVPKEPVVPEVPAEDMEPEDTDPADKEKDGFSDADVKAFTDKAIKAHAAVIEKARGFLADDYTFADKGTDEIMRDALATVDPEKFADAELALAFKLMKKPDANYKTFADKSTDSDFTKLKDKEL